MIVWIAIWGYLMIFGKSNEPLQEGVFRILRVGFIVTLGLTVATYNNVVVDFLSNGPGELATVVTGSSNGGAPTALDNLITQVFSVAKEAWNKAGIMDGNFGMYLIGAAVMVAGAVVTGVIAFLILLSKVVTTVLLAIGPLFIVMLLFHTTQRFFESWLGLVLNYGFTLVLAAGIGQLMTKLCSFYIGHSSGDMAQLWDATLLCCVLGMSTLVVKQVPSLAAALGGGVALATHGALSSTVNAMRPSTIRRQARGINRDARYAGRAMSSPYRGARTAVAAYRKRFGAGNSLTGI